MCFQVDCQFLITLTAVLRRGGLAIMWRKSLGMKVNVENCSIHYMIIDISIGEWTLGVVNNYMPHDDRSAGM